MMKNGLAVTGGILNLLFGIFHMLLGRSIHMSNAFAPDTRGLLMAFNIAGTLTIFYFAVVSLFQIRDLLTTKLGKSTLALISLYYLLRAAEEFFLFHFQPAIFVPCVLVGGIYAILFAMNPPNPSPQNSGPGI